MEDLSQIIQTIIVILIVSLFLILFLLSIFYHGKKREITILNKRTTNYQGLNSTRSKWTTVQHYTVDCKYKNSNKVHTLRCSFSIYNDLKLNKSYIVTIKMFEIIKLHRK